MVVEKILKIFIKNVRKVIEENSFTSKLLKNLNFSELKHLNEKIYYPDMEEDFWKIHEKCRRYTMTTIVRQYALYKATSIFSMDSSVNLYVTVYMP